MPLCGSTSSVLLGRRAKRFSLSRSSHFNGVTPSSQSSFAAPAATGLGVGEPGEAGIGRKDLRVCAAHRDWACALGLSFDQVRKLGGLPEASNLPFQRLGGGAAAPAPAEPNAVLGHSNTIMIDQAYAVKSA